MIGCIICGHGNFGSGMKSALNTVSGEVKLCQAIDFVTGMSSQNLNDELQKALKIILADTDSVIVFADIAGGAPFVTASLLSVKNPKIKVIGGTNLAMLANFMFMREDELSATVGEIISIGKDCIEQFEMKERKAEVVAEDGI
jgi:PTS system N-acetylgalactosamine-specific IIA component